MKRIVVYLGVNIVAFYILVNFFFGNGGVGHLLQEKSKLVRIQREITEKQLLLLSKESENLSAQSLKNIDEHLLKHGYKPENTVVFRFVDLSPLPQSSRETHLLSRIYLVFFILTGGLLLGEILLYTLRKGEPFL